MANVCNAQYELLALKKLIESRDAELLTRYRFDMFGITELANIFKIVGVLYADNGAMPSADLLKAEIAGRIVNQDKQKFYLDLLEDINSKDASGITTDSVIEQLKTQRQFRVILDGAGKLIDSVEARDAAQSVGTMRELYEKLFKDDTQESLDAGDMCNMAGKTIKYDFEKTGIASLDKRGGLIKGGLISVAGQAKAGKSLLSQQMLVYGHDNYEGSSAYFTFEQQPAEIRARILSSKSNIDIGLISSDLISAFQRLDLRIAEVAHLCDFNDNIKDFCYETKDIPDSEFWPMLWDHFKPRNSRFYITGGTDWDTLFIQMQMMVDLKNVKRFVIDYPMIIPKGRAHSSLQSWEYNLLMSRNLKSFARNNGVRIIAPAQYDDKADNVRYCSGVINDVDLMLAMTQEDGDDEYGDMGAITVRYKAFRNFLSIPEEPQLTPFKLLRAFNFAKFENFPEF